MTGKERGSDTDRERMRHLWRRDKKSYSSIRRFDEHDYKESVKKERYAFLCRESLTLS